MRVDEVRTGYAEINARRVVARTQTLFFVLLLGCVLLNHSRVAQRDGISFYAVNARTIGFAFAAYLIAAAGLWRFSQLLREAFEERLVWWGLRVVAVVLVVLLVTPFNKGAVLNWTHMSAGVAGALVQIVLAWRLGVRTRDPRAWSALVVMLVGGVVAAVSLPNWTVTYLLQGEIVLEIGFAWCVWGWTRALASPRDARSLARSSGRGSPLRRGPSGP